MLTVVAAIVVADRAEPITRTVPVGGWRRGSATARPTITKATRAPPAQRTLGLSSVVLPGEWAAAVRRGNPVDVGGAELGHRVAFDLDHVLRVLLAAVGKVEAACIHVVVRDQDLGVHEVMHGTDSVWRRTLRAELGSSDDAAKGGYLPLRGWLLSP